MGLSGVRKALEQRRVEDRSSKFYTLPCRGDEVWFLKRAQIFAGDVWGVFQVGNCQAPSLATCTAPFTYDYIYQLNEHMWYGSLTQCHQDYEVKPGCVWTILLKGESF